MANDYNYNPLQNNWIGHHYPDSKVQGANVGPTSVLSAPDGPHVGPMDLVIRVSTSACKHGDKPFEYAEFRVGFHIVTSLYLDWTLVLSKIFDWSVFF